LPSHRRHAAPLLGLLLALVFLAALAAPRPAQASRFLLAGIFDDAHVLDGDSSETFGVLQELHVKMIRVTLWWGGPKGVAASRPADATDPADPAYDWKAYDRVMRSASAAGIRVMLTILGTPTWESGGTTWNVAPEDPEDLEQFAVAAARRYDGTYTPSGQSKELPRVRYWTAWNEPNSPVFLRPQYRRVNGRWVVQSAVSYARICNAVVDGLKQNTVSKPLVACGVTAPRGNNQPGVSRSSVSPLVFVRAMKAAGADGFDAYAHHPYYGAPSETPSTPPANPGGGAPRAVTMGNLGVLIREEGRLYPHTRIWITEYGYQTDPPDTTFGVSWAKQALYLQDAWRIARASPRIDVFLWFLLQDEAPLGRWQSGLITVTGRRKPAFAAFAQLGSG
jgi:hypothetical protein